MITRLIENKKYSKKELIDGFLKQRKNQFLRIGIDKKIYKKEVEKEIEKDVDIILDLYNGIGKKIAFNGRGIMSGIDEFYTLVDVNVYQGVLLLKKRTKMYEKNISDVIGYKPEKYVIK